MRKGSLDPLLAPFWFRSARGLRPPSGRDFCSNGPWPCLCVLPLLAVRVLSGSPFLGFWVSGSGVFPGLLASLRRCLVHRWSHSKTLTVALDRVRCLYANVITVQYFALTPVLWVSRLHRLLAAFQQWSTGRCFLDSCVGQN